MWGGYGRGRSRLGSRVGPSPCFTPPPALGLSFQCYCAVFLFPYRYNSLGEARLYLYSLSAIRSKLSLQQSCEPFGSSFMVFTVSLLAYSDSWVKFECISDVCAISVAFLFF